MRLTSGLSDDVADSESLADIMEGLIPRITPLIDIVIRAGPQHVVHCIVTGTCKNSILYSTVASTPAVYKVLHKHCQRMERPGFSLMLTIHTYSHIFT